MTFLLLYIIIISTSIDNYTERITDNLRLYLSDCRYFIYSHMHICISTKKSIWNSLVTLYAMHYIKYVHLIVQIRNQITLQLRVMDL